MKSPEETDTSKCKAYNEKDPRIIKIILKIIEEQAAVLHFTENLHKGNIFPHIDG